MNLKRIFFTFIFITFFSNFFAFSKDNFSFYLEPVGNVRFGVQNELVYTKTSDEVTRKLSELNWEQLHLASQGIKGELKFFKIFIRGEYKDAIFQNTGILHDSDWLNCETDGLSDEIYEIKTNYSQSTNDLQQYYNWDLYGGYEFTIDEKFSVSPFGGIEYTYSDFLGHDGKGWYSSSMPYYSDAAKAFYEENGYYGPYTLCENDLSLCSIQLQRNVIFTWIGADFNFYPNKFLEISTSVAISPYIRVETLDTHFGKDGYNRYYLDYTTGFFSGSKGSISVSAKLHDNLKISLGTNALITNTMYGITYYHEGSEKQGTYRQTSSISGSSFRYIEVFFSFRLCF